ncbi:hypothetical protein [Rhizobium sp. CSW-27]|uniref:COG4223 family protein n=1 Tax=Rhizobium sp. CSW-27 TaxID=2839985 RepID=UPI001C03765D|nr:hypothetical protein [Rhizobium sp. CSW-27]MBT9370696.1 hypothetical protein [Rhizobium sp. CSW-27]
MVSDKPPRRSRSGKTPVTIDAAAEETKAAEAPVVAEPVRSDDTDAVTPAAEARAQSMPADGDAAAPEAAALAPSPEEREATAPRADDGAPAEPAPSDTSDIWTTSATTTAEPAPSSGTTDAGEVPPEAWQTTDAAEQTPSSGPSAPQKTESETRSAAPASPAPAARQNASGPKTSAMIASGILGGIVALALAGSMQYAGYLPGLDPQRTGATPAALEELRREIADLRAAPRADNPDLAARVQALESSIGNNGPSQEMVAELQQMKGDLDALKSALQAQGANDSELGQRLEALTEKVNQPGREQAVARALAAAALKAATERGGSFQAELQTYSEVAPDDPAVEGLRSYAADGVPTRADLARRLPAAADAMLDAAHQPVEGQSVTERLLASAMRMVRVRPVGEVAGETPEAIVARLEERVKNGDLKAAVGEWNTLPEASRQAASSFKQALDARIAVDDLMNGTLTRAMASAGANG